MGEEATPTFVRKLLRFTQGALGRVFFALVFLLSLVIGAVAHLDLPASKRAAAGLVTDLVSASIRGSIRVGSFVRLERGGISVEDVVVLDPNRRTTLKVKELSADVDVLGILQRVFSDHEKLSIEIQRVEAQGCEVLLLPTTDRDAQGALLTHPSIADAFEPVKKKKSTRKRKGRPVRVWFPRVELRKVYARGSIAGSPKLQARVPAARAKILATNKGASIDIERFRMRASGLGGVDTTANGEVHIRAPGPVWGDVKGTIGQVPLTQKFRFEDGKLDVEGALPSLRPAAVRPLYADWPLDRAILVENKVSGTPPVLDVDLRVAPVEREGAATEIKGTLQMAPELDIKLAVITHGLNLADHLSTLPVSSLDSESDVSVRQADSDLLIQVESRIAAGTVGKETTPALDLVTTVEGGVITVDGDVREPGLRARLHGSGAPDAPLTVALNLRELRLESNQRTRRLLPGTRGLVQGTVRAKLDGDVYRASSELSIGGFQRDAVSFTHATLTGNASGSLAAPEETEGQAELALTAAKIGEVKLKSATLQAQGRALSPRVELSAQTESRLNLEASAFVDVFQVELRELRAGISGRGKPVEASASRLSFANSRIAANELVLRSIGEVRGDIDFGAGGGTIQLEAEGLSISRMAESLGLPRSEYGGDLDAHVDLDVGPQSYGTVDLTMSDGALYGIDNVSFEAHATVDGDVTRGNVSGTVSALGTVESSWESTLAGPLLEPESTERATGKLSAQLRNFDLQGFSLLLGKALGLPPLEGTLNAQVDLQRTSADEFPQGEIQFSTDSLVVDAGDKEKALTVRGLDLEGGVSLAPSEDKVEAVVRLNDRGETLLSVSGALTLPLQRWGPTPPPEGELGDIIRDAPLDAVVVAPRRSLRRWPPYISLPFEQGSIGMRASVVGSLNDPTVRMVVDARRLEGGSSPFARPVDVDINAQYAYVSGALRASFNLEQEGQRVGALQADLRLPFENLTEPPRGQVALWNGEIQLQLDNTPLQLVTELRDRQVQGTAQGSISIERQGWEPQVSSELRLRSLSFGGHRLGDALLEAHTHKDDLVARANFTDDYGSLQATAEAGIVPTRSFLRIAERRSVLVTLESDRYDAAVTLPFVSDLFDELNGSLSGKLKAEWQPPAKPDGQWSTLLSGNMKMTEGTVTPTALGLRLEETRFSLTATPEGEFNIVRLNNIGARADSELHNLQGDARLFFRNLDLEGGTFHLTSKEVPLKSDGEQLAVLTGTAQGRFDMTAEETRVEVRINNLDAELPQSADSELFDLEENPDIEILQYASPRQEAPEEEESTVLDVRFTLGNNVRVKSEFLDLKIRGEPVMRLEDELSLGGTLELIPGGRIDVLGRGFTIEQGTVLFDTGDPANPHLNVTASWRAPNDVVVRVVVRGTASNPNPVFSSEPALPGGEAEVIALVLGGGGGSTDQGSASISSGLALAASEAADRFGLSGVKFYATQDSGTAEGRMANLNDDSYENYTAAFKISDELWFEGSVTTGTGAGPDVQHKTGVSGTLDWRFHPQWSARTEIGEFGTGLDLVWKYRY